MDRVKTPLARLGSQEWFHRHPRMWPLLLFAFGAAATLISVLGIERAEAARRDLELERSAGAIAAGVQRRATENLAFLMGAAAIFSTTGPVSHETFTTFARRIHSGGDDRGALGLGWTQLTAVADLAKFEASMRQSETPTFSIWPRPEAADRYVAPVVYFEPQTPRNRRALGFDMYSDPVRRQAIDDAIRLGDPVISGKVRLMQDRGEPERPAFLIFMPVFELDKSGRNTPKGLVYTALRAADFLDSSSELFRQRNVEIALYDGAPEPGSLLAELKQPGANEHSKVQHIQIGHRDWILRVSDKQDRGLAPLSRLMLGLGTVISLMVMALGWLISKRASEDFIVREALTRQVAIRTSLTRELNHRVKNTLANALSIVSLTRRRATSIDEFAADLTARLTALSATHDLLAQGEWNSTSLEAIIRTELAPYFDEDGGQVTLSGPSAELAPDDALALGLAIHELTTNAAKYGALSIPEGRVAIVWHFVRPDLVEVDWHEQGGPRVVPPVKRGFGRDLIEKIVASEFQSEIKLHFEPEGVRCYLCVPVRRPAEFALRRSPAGSDAASIKPAGG